MPSDLSYKDDLGIELGFFWNSIESAGVYVPGGTASYPSSVIMNAVPAKVAGVEKIIMVTPANAGAINPLVLYAAKISGVDKIFKIGGAQAVAALAYGTKTIDTVDVIVGPGNAYVAEAKKIVYGDVGIDMVAGPSEILVIADKNQDARNIAADLISQAEHDISAQSIFVTDAMTLADEVELEVAEQLTNLPRKEIANFYTNNIKNISLPYQHSDTGSSWHLYVIGVKDRESTFKNLLKRGIQTQIHYIPVNVQPFYNLETLRNTANFYEHCLSLPIYFDLKDEERAKVVDCLNND